MLGLVAGGLLLLQHVVRAYQAATLSQVLIAAPQFLAVALVAASAATSVQIAGWLLLMRALGVQLDWQQGMSGFSLAFLPRYIPGSVWGYFSRNEWLLQKHAVPYATSNAGSLLEVFFIVFVGGLLSLLYGAALLGQLPGIVVGVACMILVLLVGWTFSRLTPRLAQSASNISQHRLALPHFSLITFMIVTFLYVLLWLCHGLTLWFVIGSFGYQPPSELLPFVFTYYVSWTAGFVMLFVPAGLGVRESTLIIMLRSILGLMSSLAVTVSVFARVISLSSELIFVVISMLYTRLLARNLGSIANT